MESRNSSQEDTIRIFFVHRLIREEDVIHIPRIPGTDRTFPETPFVPEGVSGYTAYIEGNVPRLIA